jgi:hypothetical protein
VNFQILLGALESYSANEHSVPPAVRTDEQGVALSSWRFQLLPYLTAVKHDNDRKRAWNDPINEYWRTSEPQEWFAAARPDFSPKAFAITGPGTAFDSAHIVQMQELEPNLIMIVEVTQPKVHWMEPRDFTLEEQEDAPWAVPLNSRNLGSKDFLVGFADGEVWRIAHDVPISRIRQLATRSGAKSASREDVLGSYRRDQ